MHEKITLLTLVNSVDPDQPAYWHGMISVCTVRCLVRNTTDNVSVNSVDHDQTARMRLLTLVYMVE